MRILLITGLLFSGLFLTSCHSSKQLTGQEANVNNFHINWE